MRLAPRAQALLSGDRLVVRDGTTAALAGRLLDAGVAHPDLPAASAPDGVTVVIPVRDRPAALARLLAALRSDPATAGLPVVVVDDGSADPVDIAGARVVRHATARGPAAARNAGLRTATTPLVAFLDSDCVPRPGWLAPLTAHFRDPRLALAAPRIVPLPGGRGWVAPYEAAVSALDMGERPAGVRPHSAVSYVPSAALLARRVALGAGFDETMRVAEDVDLVWRLVGAGWRVRYEPAAAVAHEHPAATGEWLRRRAFYGTGAALLAGRHGSAVAPVVIAPSMAVAWGLAVVGGRRGGVAAVAILAGTTVRLARRLAPPRRPESTRNRRRPRVVPRGRRPFCVESDQPTAVEAPPIGLAAGLVARGAATAGRTLARAVTRHHWPLALTAALFSDRARRRVLAAAVLDAGVAWWPHRRRVGPVRFAVARRLEDLAYGAGLWAGVLRAGDPRALLPARPPRS